jgi:hypothetical protein
MRRRILTASSLVMLLAGSVIDPSAAPQDTPGGRSMLFVGGRLITDGDRPPD